MVYKLYTMSWTTNVQAALRIFNGFSADLLHLSLNDNISFSPQRPGSEKVLTPN